jgi:hypothetical protein
MRSGFVLALVALFSASRPSRVAAVGENGDNAPPRFELGLGARFMPVGWFNLTDPAGRSFRAYPALGGDVFFDHRLGRAFSVGVGVEVTGNVIPNRSDYVVGTLYGGTLRLGARYPTPSRFEPFAMVTCGYSLISFSSGTSSAGGALLGAWVGSHIKLGSTTRLLAQLGYERGFQTISGDDYAPSYVVTELGWLVAF